MERGQIAYEAYRLHHQLDFIDWSSQPNAYRSKWAAVEQAVLDNALCGPFKIGDLVCFRSALESCRRGWNTPNFFVVAEEVIRICSGGMQYQYFVGGKPANANELVLASDSSVEQAYDDGLAIAYAVEKTQKGQSKHEENQPQDPPTP